MPRKLPPIEKLRSIVSAYIDAKRDIGCMVDIHSEFMDECEDDEDLDTLDKINDMIERFDMLKSCVSHRERWMNKMMDTLRYKREQMEELESMHLKPDPSNFRQKIEGVGFRPLHDVALRCWARSDSLDAFRTSFEKEADNWLNMAFVEDGNSLSKFHMTVMDWKEGKDAILKLEF